MGMTKTKLLQLGTTLCRWTAFLLMILMATIQLIQNGPKGSPPAANPRGFSSLFGVAGKKNKFNKIYKQKLNCLSLCIYVSSFNPWPCHSNPRQIQFEFQTPLCLCTHLCVLLRPFHDRFFCFCPRSGHLHN